MKGLRRHDVPATDFAITTVNVPDRLDQREVDDRMRDEEDSRRASFDRTLIVQWGKRVLLAAVAAGLVFLVVEAFNSWRESLSAPQVAKRLSSALGVPVSIGGSGFALTPSPRLVLTEIEIDRRIHLDEVSLAVSGQDLQQFLRGRGWRWGEAVVAPVTLTVDQIGALFDLLPKLGDALPQSLSAMRFDRLQVSDHPWLSGRFQANLARDADGNFTAVSAVQTESTGKMRLTLTPVPQSGLIRFQCDAQNWVLPFGPKVSWSEIFALGSLSPSRVEVPQFSLGGSFGVVQGHLVASSEGSWVLSGTAQTLGLDLETMMLQLVPPAAREAAPAGTLVPVQGTAAFNAVLTGRGASLVEAVSNTSFEAPLRIRWATLNGVNLGYAATRPGAGSGTSGGLTRFTDLDIAVLANSKGIQLRNIRGRAGAMATRGEVTVSPDMALSGTLHVDLGATRVQAPIRVQVHGTALHPQFGR
jgi:hypothetical protein